MPPGRPAGSMAFVFTMKKALMAPFEAARPPGLRHATIGLAGRGEMLPNPDTYCEIDPERPVIIGPPRFGAFHRSSGRITSAPGQGNMPGDLFPRHPSRPWAANIGTTTSIPRAQYPFGIWEEGGQIYSRKVGHTAGAWAPSHTIRSQWLFCQRTDVKNLVRHRWRAAGHQNPDKNPTLTIWRSPGAPPEIIFLGRSKNAKPLLGRA